MNLRRVRAIKAGQPSGALAAGFLSGCSRVTLSLLHARGAAPVAIGPAGEMPAAGRGRCAHPRSPPRDQDPLLSGREADSAGYLTAAEILKGQLAGYPTDTYAHNGNEDLDRRSSASIRTDRSSSSRTAVDQGSRRFACANFGRCKAG